MHVPRHARHCLCDSSAWREQRSVRAARAAGPDTVAMQNLPAAIQLANSDLANVPHTRGEEEESYNTIVALTDSRPGTSHCFWCKRLKLQYGMKPHCHRFLPFFH